MEQKRWKYSHKNWTKEMGQIIIINPEMKRSVYIQSSWQIIGNKIVSYYKSPAAANETDHVQRLS